MIREAKKFALISFKGGVAKTSTSVSLAAGIKMQRPDSKVLLIDTDPQANIKNYFSLKLKEGADFAEFMIDGTFDESGLHRVKTESGEIDIFLTSKRLGSLEAEVAAKGLRKTDELLKFRMNNSGLLSKYTDIVVDTSPYMGLMNVNVFTFVDYIIIPVNLDAFTIPTIESVISNLNSIAPFYEKLPQILGILPTRLDSRSSQEKGILEVIKGRYAGKIRVFDPIGQDAGVKRAAVKKQFIYDINVRASAQYEMFTQRVLEIVENG